MMPSFSSSMKTKASVRNWPQSSSSSRNNRGHQTPNAQKGTEPKLDSRSCLERACALCLFNLDASSEANVVLARAVKESRHVVNLNNSHVDVLAGANVHAPAESHGEGCVSFLSIRQPVVKVHAHVRHARHGLDERSHGFTTEVITWPDHQIVSLCARGKGAARFHVKITVIVIGAGQARHNTNVPRDILIELRVKAVVVLALVVELYGLAVELGFAVAVECRRVIVGAFISIADVKFVM